MVRLPVTAYSASPFFATLVDLKVILGNFSTSKKSALFRWPSRCASPVFTVATSTEASTEERVASVACSVSTPERPEKLPLTLEIIMCLTLNSAPEWAGSRFQVVVDAAVAVVIVELLPSSFWMREGYIRCNNYL